MGSYFQSLERAVLLTITGGNSVARKKLLWKSAVEKISDKSTLLPKHIRASSTDASAMSVISGDASRNGVSAAAGAVSSVNRELRLSEDFIHQINRNIVTAAHQQRSVGIHHVYINHNCEFK